MRSAIGSPTTRDSTLATDKLGTRSGTLVSGNPAIDSSQMSGSNLVSGNPAIGSNLVSGRLATVTLQTARIHPAHIRNCRIRISSKITFFYRFFYLF